GAPGPAPRRDVPPRGPRPQQPRRRMGRAPGPRGPDHAGRGGGRPAGRDGREGRGGDQVRRGGGRHARGLRHPGAGRGRAVAFSSRCRHPAGPLPFRVCGHKRPREVTVPTDVLLDDPHTVPTRWWHTLDDGRVQCDVCPRACKLREGQRGLCFVRGRLDDQIVLASYGRSSGFCVDPIEKKPLNHFLPGTPVLSFGTAGCNLACRFCQNWDISKSREIDTLSSSASPDALADAAERLGCRSIAFTYNDPVIFMEYAMDVADACR